MHHSGRPLIVPGGQAATLSMLTGFVKGTGSSSVLFKASQTVDFGPERWPAVGGQGGSFRYRPEIDGLRSLAVIAVILFHARFQGFAGGFVGVDIFFVISGYLITSLIQTEKQTGTFSLFRFYERRARRILPALSLAVVFCLPLAWLSLTPDGMKEFSGSLLAVATFTSNIFFWLQSGYFDSAVHLKPLVHTWSLAIEVQFYLLFPLLLIVIWPLNKWLVVVILAALAIASLALSQWGAFNQPTATFYLLPTRSWEFLIGALVAFYLSAKQDFAADNANNHTLANLFSFLGVLLIAVAICFFDESTPFPSFYALLPTLATALVILFATPVTLVGRILRIPVLVRVGLISYGLYLWHQPFFAFAWNRREGAEPTTVLLILLCCLAATLAFVTWKYIEAPCRDRKQVRRPAFLALMITGSIIMLAFGSLGLIDGDAKRYAPDRYVSERRGQLYLREFIGSRKNKVIIIGDSFAGDLVNALFESGVANNTEISTFPIAKVCGNLFLSWDFSKHIPPRDRNDCMARKWYHNESLQNLMKQADVLLLASSWLHWVAELLPESVGNIERVTGKKVIVFGPKDFGSASTLSKISILPRDKRPQADVPISNVIAGINAYMRGTIPPSIYVDTLEVLCASQTRCPAVTEDGELISIDGAHLTKDGARFFGERLKSHPIIIKSFATRSVAALLSSGG
jgi:peptidoglycan/LPS O-acetylase OafA/YrhL